MIRSVAPCRNSQPNQSNQRSTTHLWLELQPCIKILALHDKHILSLKPTRTNTDIEIRVQSVRGQGHSYISAGYLASHLTASVKEASIYIKPRVNLSIIGANLRKQVATLTIISERCTNEIRVWEQVASLRRLVKEFLAFIQHSVVASTSWISTTSINWVMANLA